MRQKSGRSSDDPVNDRVDNPPTAACPAAPASSVAPRVLASAGFPNVARLELDELLEQLIGRARDVQATQGRLRGLLRANMTVAQAVDLDEVLLHILDAARTLVDARYAALGLVEQGRMVRFLHVGVDQDAVAAIGHLPEGKGLLGRLIDYPRPLRLPDISEHLSSVGFPENHPPMHSFLGVPIRLAQRVFGNIYLTDKRGADEFSHDDEELVLALAAAAGAAIENAGRFAESRRRQDWQAAMVALSTALLTGDNPALALPQIVYHARITSAAAGASVCVPTDETGVLRVAATEGMLRDWDGVTAPVEGSIYAEALNLRRPVVVNDPATDPRTSARVDADSAPLGPTVAVPMVSDVAADGVLFVCRDVGQSAFDELDLEMLSVYAAHAALVLQLARARQDNEMLRMAAERQHIAEELHHRVIQRLFRLGLDLQGVSARVPDPQLRDVINLKIDETDAVIRELRDAIFSLRPAGVPTAEG